MKAKLKWFVALGCTLALAAGCSDNYFDEPEDLPDVTPKHIGEIDASLYAAQDVFSEKDSGNASVMVAFYVAGKDNYGDRTAYVWLDAGTDNKCNVPMENVEKSGFKMGVLNLSSLDGIPTDAKNALKEGKTDVKIIIKNLGESWDWQTPDLVLPLSGGNKHFLITSGSDSKSPATVDEIIAGGDLVPAIKSAATKNAETITATLSVPFALETSANSNGFYVRAGDDKIYASDVRNADSLNDRYRNYARNVQITLSQSIDATKTWRLYNDYFEGSSAAVSMQGADKDAAEQVGTYDGTDLGLTLNGSTGTFKIWAPLASDVKLLVYNTAADVVGKKADGNEPDRKSVIPTTDVALRGTPAKDPIEMRKDPSSGVWSCTLDNATSYKYYKYQIVNSGTTYYVCDINAKAASPDATAAQIVDINAGTSYGKQEGYKNPFKKSYTDAVIYEMHITDWSYAEDQTTGNVGKYQTIANGTKVIEYLKELGITHVQLLPVFEFAETNANKDYNWGYNPYHYNVPEGRYVVNMIDGTDAVNELRTLIEKFHSADIAVNMDVVYNHTSGTGEYSLYDSTVPHYYYRFDGAGNYSNGSGCGNEIDTEAPMMKKYIIDSLKHWMLDYHINGFRFDLMGCISKSTMKEIYEELKKIDPNVMVYGEPWTGGTAAVNDGAVQAVADGVGAFDDDFRDAIKGAEFGGFQKGQVQGVYNDDHICKGLVGAAIDKNNRNTTGKLGLALHYVECHDNYTLFDKLAMSYLGRTSFSGDLFNRLDKASTATTNAMTEVKNQDKLAAAYVFLSQGTAFINGGQEFLRTKRGNENSYNTNANKTNSIDLGFKTKYSDVYNMYKGLIALRKAHPSAFGANTSAKAETVKTGVTKYTAGDFLVYFNATDAAADITTTGYTKAVDVSSGTPTESTTVPTSVPAKSFVILKK